MPLIYLFLICLVLAVKPGLLLLVAIIWGANRLIRRQRMIDGAGVNAMFGGASMADAAVIAGRRRL